MDFYRQKGTDARKSHQEKVGGLLQSHFPLVGGRGGREADRVEDVKGRGFLKA